jgi:L-methionine (R)-S-oxide reductase
MYARRKIFLGTNVLLCHTHLDLCYHHQLQASQSDKMVHADAAFLPDHVKTKGDLYEHLYQQLQSLLADQRSWVSNLSNASSVIYHTLNSFPPWKDEKKVNWAGFYLLSPLLPSPPKVKKPTLLLGPFHGLPACQLIFSVPGKGVCADASALLPPRTVKVDRTEDYPGHIACDSASQSEIVVPIVVAREKVIGLQAHAGKQEAELPIEWQGRGEGEKVIVGVLDIDCEAVEGFDQEDVKGLERIAELISTSCDW